MSRTGYEQIERGTGQWLQAPAIMLTREEG